MQLSYASSDELTVLRPEMDDRDAIAADTLASRAGRGAARGSGGADLEVGRDFEVV